MRQIIKRFFCIVGLTLGLQSAWGFALLGPLANNPNPALGRADSWQIPAIGYGLPYLSLGLPGGGMWFGDIGGPKNIAEEYRRNAPVLYYAYDENFSSFFGAAGETAVDGAFAIMNGLTNVDSYSSDLSEFPFQSQAFNYQALAVYLTDIKSVTLHLLVEQMGLAQPERFTWTLHDRVLGSKCPVTTTYLLVERNLGIVPSPLSQVQYSPYVNNTLYSYYIIEECSGPNPQALAVPFPVDPEADKYTAVAANNYDGIWSGSVNVGGLLIGGFYTGLTRDDVGGLRYLMTTNNVNYETAAAGSLLVSSSGGGIGGVTYGPQVLLSTSNYTTFWLSARTNDPVTLSNLFPGLVIISSSYVFTNVATPILVTNFVNLIGAPAGSPLMPVVTTNGFNNTQFPIYSDSFANLDILTNSFSPNTKASLVTVTVGVPVGSPVGSPLQTNTSTKAVTLTGVPSGEYYINTNYLCGPVKFISTLATNVTVTTNLISSTVNAAGNVLSSQTLITSSTTHVFVVQWPICSSGTVTNSGGIANATGRYQGIQRVQFVRVPDTQVDPLTGNFLQPIISFYTNVFFNPTNSQLEQQIFQRVVSRPDILMSAVDDSGANTFNGTISRGINFNQANVLPGLAGPGTIDGSVTFFYNKIGTAFWNGPFPDTNSFIGSLTAVNQTTATPSVAWASFDATTNVPVLYPNGTSIQDLENQLVISIQPSSLPDGTNDVLYPTTFFSATGGVAPYSWSLGAGTLLPSGLAFSSGGVLYGTPSGNAPGIYDFTIQLTDSQNRVVALNYSITIH